MGTMNKRAVVSAAVAITFILSACGGTTAGTTPSAFSDQLATVCRTINRGIGNLGAPASLDDVRSNASDASTLYEEGITQLKKLTVPTSDTQFASDVKDLIASFGDQLDTLDAIAKAAKEKDQSTVDTRMSKLTDQASQSNDLADSLNISRCQIDPVFATIATTPTTEPAVPLTLPIAPTTSATIPPDTLPADTAPASTNKVIVSSAALVPLGSYTFADAPASAITGFQTLLDLAPSMASQSGRITGLDVVDSTGATMGRLFAFESDTDPLTAGSFDEVTPSITSDTPTTPKTVGTLDGLSWTDPDGTVNFLVAVSNVLLWSFAPSQDFLDATLQAWGESISQ
ncbi:MAG: hypothetical protein QOJ74_1861 [Ilumatobacteraceae bacterium]|nr:hypothetical protein [Ilumatobacteraceae bacterium]